MGCRIGMATDVEERLVELLDDELIPPDAEYETLRTGLTYAEANKVEVALRKACGPGCDGQAGGGYKEGKVWSVYRVDW